MAVILRGKNKDRVVRITQWCNNWVSIDLKPYIVSITNLKLDKSEIDAIMRHKNNGYMLQRFELKDRFVKRES